METCASVSSNNFKGMLLTIQQIVGVTNQPSTDHLLTDRQPTDSPN